MASRMREFRMTGTLHQANRRMECRMMGHRTRHNRQSRPALQKLDCPSAGCLRGGPREPRRLAAPRATHRRQWRNGQIVAEAAHTL